MHLLQRRLLTYRQKKQVFQIITKYKTPLCKGALEKFENFMKELVLNNFLREILICISS